MFPEGTPGRIIAAWFETRLNVALSLDQLAEILPCELRDLDRSWEYFRRKDLQAPGGGRHQLCHHEARAYSARIHVRSPLLRCRIQAGGMTKDRPLNPAAPLDAF